jgi:tRNA-splicing ligase RtcB (3'-phosphate/5'-hydroxy nucleic acid ligase)
MKAKDIQKAGVPAGPLVKLTMGLLGPSAQAGLKKKQISERLRNIVAAPDAYVDDPLFGELAKAMVGAEEEQAKQPSERAEPAPWRMWGSDLDRAAIDQMRNACRLPVAVRGALMPDAHVGYGLPIGGVLATDNAVIPFAVGVDIACRMMLSITDLPVSSLDRDRDHLGRVLEQETCFGSGGTFKKPKDHSVMHEDWDFSPVTKRIKGKAQSQLGTSGSGNHFVEYGIVTFETSDLNLDAGQYVAILSHSGSRGPGASVANHFWKQAMELHKGLPKQLLHLGWLGLDTDLGREYWHAMQLMGRFAAANHEIIHRELVRALKSKTLAQIENHHNFAWKETHDGREVIVHRKGATPAAEGVLGIIPGSMASPGFLVRGSFRHLIEMVEAHSELLEELPELESQIEDCRVAVGLACGLQPDLEAHWKKLRKAQRKKVRGTQSAGRERAAGRVGKAGKAGKARKTGKVRKTGAVNDE